MSDSLADRLKALRAARGWTQRELAAAAGLTQGAVHGVESGRRTRMEADILLRLAEALGVQPRELLPRVDPRPGKKSGKSGESS